MARNYSHALDRLVNRPLLVTPGKAREILYVLANRAGLAERLTVIDGADRSALSFDFDEPRGRGRGGKSYCIEGGVATIPIEGTLVHKLGTLDPYSGMTGYDGLAMKLEEAAHDPDVRGILLDIDSPGGEVAGCFDLCDRIRNISDLKPVWAVADELACSAAYAIASQAHKLFVPRTGDIGSIGVVCMHVDVSQWLESEGINVTLIHAGAHKVDGNPYEALPEAVRADIQRDIESVRLLFADTVAAGGRIDRKGALATEARVFMGQSAVDAGLADGVAAPDEALAMFIESLADTSAPSTLKTALHERTPIMGAKTGNPRRQRAEDEKPEDENDKKKPGAEDKKPEDDAEDDKPEDDAEDDKPEDDAEDDKPEDDAEGEDGGMEKPDAKAAAGERKRVSSILGCAEAKGRQGQAQALALNTSLSLSEARAVLASSPKESKGLAGHMAGIDQPDVGADGGKASRRTGDGAVVDRITANHRALTGRGRQK